MNNKLKLTGLFVAFLFGCSETLSDRKKDIIPINPSGQKDGIEILYWPNGNVKSRSVWANNVPNGEYIQYREDGSIIDVGNIINGKKEGEFKLYYPNGKLQAVQHFENDLKNGIYISYYFSGANKRLSYYELDSLVCDINTDSLGNYKNGLIRFRSEKSPDTVKINQSFKVEVELFDSLFIKHMKYSRSNLFNSLEEARQDKWNKRIAITSTKVNKMFFEIPKYESVGLKYYNIEISATDIENTGKGKVFITKKVFVEK
jgi:hypothetical protein